MSSGFWVKERAGGFTSSKTNFQGPRLRSKSFQRRGRTSMHLVWYWKRGRLLRSFLTRLGLLDYGLLGATKRICTSPWWVIRSSPSNYSVILVKKNAWPLNCRRLTQRTSTVRCWDVGRLSLIGRASTWPKSFVLRMNSTISRLTILLCLSDPCPHRTPFSRHHPPWHQSSQHSDRLWRPHRPCWLWFIQGFWRTTKDCRARLPTLLALPEEWQSNIRDAC